jgi:putative addiction module component (TIGR02574 family)
VEPDETVSNGERHESIEDAWHHEIERRALELDSGTAETVPWEIVRARLRARLHARRS